jgi:hypothetical protein
LSNAVLPVPTFLNSVNLFLRDFILNKLDPPPDDEPPINDDGVKDGLGEGVLLGLGDGLLPNNEDGLGEDVLLGLGEGVLLGLGVDGDLLNIFDGLGVFNIDGL